MRNHPGRNKGETLPSRLTQQQFLERAIAVHNGCYRYPRLVYLNSSTQVSIECPVHGEFRQLPLNHLRGSGCFLCGTTRQVRARTYGQKTFVAKARAVHGTAYDYALANYRTALGLVTIGCRIHGSFKQRANNHLAGIGCPRCADDTKRTIFLKSKESFVSEAMLVHDGLYDYSEFEYKGTRAPINSACPRHGPFTQLPMNLLGESGCPSCTGRISKPHLELEAFLDESGIRYRRSDRIQIAPLEIDLFMPDHKLGLEFNGTYWHSLNGTEPSSCKFKHQSKFQQSCARGLRLLQIDEHEWNSPVQKQVWLSVIRSKLGLHARLHARKTVFCELEPEESDLFLHDNHLQGATPASRWRFGLRHNGILVAVATYAAHQKKYLNLSRMAFKRDLTVVGGAQKILKGSLAALPPGDMITFSNNRYSDGGLYRTLGFELSAPLPPSYQWIFRNKVWNKRRLRRDSLQRLLGDQFNPLETEHENLYRNKARCLYDAGYQRWLLSRPL